MKKRTKLNHGVKCMNCGKTMPSGMTVYEVSGNDKKQYLHYGKCRSVDVEVKKFSSWLELEYPNITLTEKQINVLEAFFALNKGEGKTFLTKPLLEYDYSNGISNNRKLSINEVM